MKKNITKGGGTWGFYSDDNDLVLQFIIFDIEEKILPTKLKYKTHSKKTNPKEEEYIKKQINWIINHPHNVVRALKKGLKKTYKSYNKLDKEDRYRYNNTVSGVALYLARKWTTVPFGVKNKFPSKLPPKYPVGLKKMAHLASTRLLKEFDNHFQWKNPQGRVKALKNQIKLFQ